MKYLIEDLNQFCKDMDTEIQTKLIKHFPDLSIGVYFNLINTINDIIKKNVRLFK